MDFIRPEPYLSLVYPPTPNSPPSAAGLNEVTLTCHFRAAKRRAVEEAALAILIRQFDPREDHKPISLVILDTNFHFSNG